MKLSIFAKPGAKEEKIEKISETEYRVSVKEPAKEGRASHLLAYKSLARCEGK